MTYHLGLGLLCCLALLSGFISVLLNSRVHDVPVERMPNEQSRSFRELFRTPFKDPGFRKFLLYGVAFNGSLQFAGSYFPYYFTKELHLPMSYFALWSGIASLGCFLTSNYWGRRIDKTGVPFEVLRITSFAIAVAPLVYLIKSPEIIKIVAPIEYLFSGLAWSGFLLAQTKILLRLSPMGDSAAYFSVYATLCGLSGAIFTFLGGQLVEFLIARGEFRSFWLIAAVMRLLMMQLKLTETLPNEGKKISLSGRLFKTSDGEPALLQAEEKPNGSVREPLRLPEA
ncbi:MAG: MFS transporter [Bdellovibrionia bacterium]